MSVAENEPPAGSPAGAGATGALAPGVEESPAATLPVQVILPPRRWESLDLAQLVASRHIFWALLSRNVRMRHRQTLLGPVWFMLVPFIRMVLLSLVLGGLANLPSEGVPYPLFTYSALLPWTLFQSGATRATECLVRYQHVVSKIYFPRLLLPMAEVGTAVVDYLLSLGILLLLMVWYRFPLTLNVLWLPVYLALAMVFALAVGLALAGLHARFRDVITITGYTLQVGFYATPIAYSASIVDERVPQSLRWAFDLNPLKVVVEGARWSLVGAGHPPGIELVFATAAALALLYLCAKLFRASEPSIVDLI